MNWEYKIVRDPLYGYIGLTEQEVNLLQTRFLQRLHRIKQLGFTYLVYPSAVHTRFEHSLGTLFIADRIAQQIHLEDIDRQIVRITALLHDIGQGPFSHVFDNILSLTNDDSVNHEKIGMRILETDSEIANVLEKKVRERIIRLLSGEESILHDIISSSLDADKLDYLRRDCYHIGVMYGMFDIYRILHMLDTDEKGDHLVVKEKAKDALENFRIAKYLMHIQVYQHHVRAISDAMFTRAMEIALSERVVDKELLIYKNPKFLAHYFSLDDDSMITRVLDTADANSKARALMYALKNRNLFKRAYSIDLNTVRDELTRQGLAKIDRKQVKEYERKIYDVFKKRVKTTSTKLPEDHIDWLHNIYWDTPDLIILYPQRITNPLYKEPYQTRMERPILIKMDDGPISSLDDVSSITGASQKYIDRIYIFCPDDGKGKEDLTGIRSIIDKIADSLLLSS